MVGPAAGILAGGVVGLDLGHVDFPNGTARVTGKGRKERVVPIGRTATGLLENYVKGVRPFLVRDPSEQAFFLDEQGKRLWT
jgi:site-specific recombinase XerD